MIYYQDDLLTLYHGDCVKLLAELEENSIDSIVEDPPYHLTQVSRNGSPRQNDPNTPFGRTRLGSKGFMGKSWDGGDIAFRPETWEAHLRVLKPGAFAAVFSGTRTVHRVTCAIEDAGFTIENQLQWNFSSGFPHGIAVDKALDAMAGKERDYLGEREYAGGHIQRSKEREFFGSIDGGNTRVVTAAATELAKQWTGWNSAIKPAHEPIILAQKPLDTVTCSEIHTLTGWNFYCTKRTIERTKEYRVELWTFKAMHGQVRSYSELRKYPKGEKGYSILKTEDAGEFKAFSVCNVAANILKWGVGALHVDACRVGSSGWTKKDGEFSGSRNGHIQQIKNREAGVTRSSDVGRWPSNVLYSHHPLCVRVGERKIRGDNRTGGKGRREPGFMNIGSENGDGEPNGPLYGDSSVPEYSCVPGCAVAELNRQSGITTSGNAPKKRSAAKFKDVYGEFEAEKDCGPGRQYNEGAASRFFFNAEWSEEDLIPFRYIAKASRLDRDKGLEDADLKTMNRVNPGGLENDPRWGPIQVRNNHSTVKPWKLLAYLQRLTTPPGGVSLDAFAGSGTSGVAASIEGFHAILIEQDAEYVELAKNRLAGSIPPLFRQQETE